MKGGGEVTQMPHNFGTGSKVGKVIDNIVEHMGRFGAVMTAVLMFLIFFDITLRFFINKPIAESFEYSRLLFAVIVVIVAAYVDKYDAHVRVEALITRFPLKPAEWLNLIMNCASLSLVGYLTYIFTLTTAEAFSRAEVSYSVLWLPIWPFKTLWCVGLGFLGIMLIRRIIRNITTIRS